MAEAEGQGIWQGRGLGQQAGAAGSCWGVLRGGFFPQDFSTRRIFFIFLEFFLVLSFSKHFLELS